MRLVEPPYSFKFARRIGIICFLAGGITNCWEWQDAVINTLRYYDTEKLIVANPRRPNFPINDPKAAAQQIAWEFYWLERCDIFSMYFVASEQSDQPICMYELGRNVMAMQHRFPESYKNRIVLSCEDGYRREADVKAQMNLALGRRVIISTTPEEHAKRIVEAYHKLLKA